MDGLGSDILSISDVILRHHYVWIVDRNKTKAQDFFKTYLKVLK